MRTRDSVLLLGLLVATSAFAAAPASGSSVTRGNFLRVPQYQNSAALALFVNASTGNDTFDCLSASTPCLTLAGADAKIPRGKVQFTVTVNVAAGNYTGHIFEGFNPVPTTKTSSSSVNMLTIQGPALINFSPATGTATGTATAGAGCSSSEPFTTSASLTDSGQTWTVDNLRQQLIEITGGTGSGQIQPIASNTATVVTVGGCWTTPPDATSTYAIRDWAAVITTAVGGIGIGVGNATPFYWNNNTNAVLIDRMKMNVGGCSVTNSSVLITNSLCGGSAGIGLFMNGGARVRITNSVARSNTLIAISTSDRGYGVQSVQLQNVFVISGTTTGTVVLVSSSTAFNLTDSTITATSSSATDLVLTSAGLNVGSFWSRPQLNCTAGGATYGIRANNANNASPFVNSTVASFYFDTGIIRECPTSVSIVGHGVHLGFDGSTLQATAGTTAIEVALGGDVNLDTNTTISGSFTNQISIDASSWTFANFRALSPAAILNMNYGTNIQAIP